MVVGGHVLSTRYLAANLVTYYNGKRPILVGIFSVRKLRIQIL